MEKSLLFTHLCAQLFIYFEMSPEAQEAKPILAKCLLWVCRRLELAQVIVFLNGDPAVQFTTQCPNLASLNEQQLYALRDKVHHFYYRITQGQQDPYFILIGDNVEASNRLLTADCVIHMGDNPSISAAYTVPSYEAGLVFLDFVAECAK